MEHGDTKPYFMYYGYTINTIKQLFFIIESYLVLFDFG